MDNKRLEWIDFAKALAIILVVLVHSIEQIYGYFMYGEGIADNASYLFASVGFTLGRIGVPLFIFSSGYLILGKKFKNIKEIIRFYKNNLLPLFLTNLSWVLIYNIFDRFLFHTEIRIVDIIREIFGLQIVPNMWHMWYIPCLFGMYIVAPIVSILINYVSNILFIVILMFAMTYCFVVPTLCSISYVFSVNIPVVNSIPILEISVVAWFCLYAILGYKIQCIVKNPIYFVATMLVTITVQYYSIKNGTKYLMWYNNLLILFPSFFLFRYISQLDFNDKTLNYSKVKGMTNYLAKHSFAIYYIHMIIRHLFATPFASIKLNGVLLVIMFEAACMCLSIAIIYLIEKLKFKQLNRILLFVKR